MLEKIIVLKFGSSVLRAEADISNIVHEIYRWYRSGYRVVAVVSALGTTTDSLLAQARAFTAAPEPFATAELLATGERVSAALVGIALDRSGIPGRVLNPREIGLTVAGHPLDSALVSADTARLQSLLTQYPVLIVPGFFGTDCVGRTHLLGRGGSDLSAVFLADTLRTPDCRLIKDVDGIYEADPARSGGALLQRFQTLNYEDAHRIAVPLIQPKAVSFLEHRGGRAEVAAPGRSYSSIVSGGSTQRAAAVSNTPSKVLLLGLGTVSFGVYQRLLANSAEFVVLGALVRTPQKYAPLTSPNLYTDLQQLESLRPDIVVDALPGVEPSLRLIQHFLHLGAQVISANKAVIAEHGPALLEQARGKAMLRYSAAVGGAAPMIEAVDSVRIKQPIVSIAGVLNATCNVVLDLCAKG